MTGRCIVTHPFHPLRGQSFEVIDRRVRFGQDSILALAVDGQFVRFAAAWTDLAARDPFVEIANHRALFCPSDLIELRKLLASVAVANQQSREAVAAAKVISK